jgi:hypothetical protein
VLDLALGILVATDAGSASGLAWYGVAFSVAMLAVSLGLGSSTAFQTSLGVIGLVLLLRRDDRLVLAPIYGAALLVLSELARTSHEVRRLELIGRGSIRARLLTTLLFTGLGACGAGVVAIAVTRAPVRSVAVSALGTAAVAAAFAGVVLIARRSQSRGSGADPSAGSQTSEDETWLDST